MTKISRKTINYLKRGFRPLTSGLILGFLISWVVVGVVLPMQQAKAYVGGDATSQGMYCFSATQCHKSMTGQSACQSKNGCCVVDRCFMPGEGCQATGTGAGGTMGLCYAKSPPIELKVRFGDTDTGTVVDIGDYLEKAYKYAVGIAAFLAAIMMIIGGFFYLTAGDNQSRVTQGKDYIKDALIGLAVALSAWLILNTINPDLIRMQLPKVPVIKRTPFIGCTITELCQPCGVKYTVWVDADGNPPPTDTAGCAYTSSDEKEHTKGEYEGAGCVGKSCHLSGGGTAQCKDDVSRCRSSDDQNITTVDCGVEEEAGFVCASCGRSGDDCSPDGNNDDCCGGFCGNGECTGGQPGDECDDDSGKECISGICQTEGWDSCSSGKIGSPCDDDDQCVDGNKCQDSTYFTANYCSPGNEYNRCDPGDSNCRSGLVCNAYLKVCQKPGMKLYTCNKTSDCPPAGLDHCQFDDINFCTDGSPGSPCEKWQAECAPLEGCTYPNGWKCRGFCVEEINGCTAGENGVPCDDGWDCRSGRCSSKNLCVSGHLGGRCGSSMAQNVPKCQDGLVCGGDDNCGYP